MDYHQHTVPAGPPLVAVPAPSHPLTHHQLHQLQTLVQADDSTSSRWSQYQQLWRHHHMQHINGKTGNKEGGPEEKKDDGELWCNVEAQAAFLGPNLWDKTLPYDADLKYVDLDEFLSENGIPVDGLPQSTAQQQQQQVIKQGSPLPEAARGLPQPHTLPPHPAQTQQQQQQRVGDPSGPPVLELVTTKRERSPTPSEPLSPDTLNPPSPADSISLSALSLASSGREFDPRTRAFSDEELKPQPMIKKSRKQDEKYWARRRKNNMAAKRSRDARRVKENQIALRAGFLEKENMGLRQELDRLKKENLLLRDKLSKFTDV
ncbi:thyrotroph embryonic factor isoform X3 [Periplaneta americana]|uniref:thyrotroph embryonic factor isoform X3 n=1 Tax=Periplaneta americana TaxID=6978 RepID=UPI0037E7A04D